MSCAARMVTTSHNTGDDLLTAISDALAVARVAAPEVPVQLHAISREGGEWELTVVRRPMPESSS